MGTLGYLDFTLDERLASRVFDPSPDDKLRIAVLDDAFDCYGKGLTSRKAEVQREYRRARDWIALDDLDWPFSFLNCCSAGGVDPDAVRCRLKALRREVLAGRMKTLARRDRWWRGLSRPLRRSRREASKRPPSVRGGRARKVKRAGTQ